MRYSILAWLATCSAALSPSTASSQAVVQPLNTTDADRLSNVMRRVAAAPTDVGALVEAGELSVRLDDASAAAALFARAEKLDPQNGRVKAGMGAILVRAERPGEALRYFNQAEGYGWPAARYAADRGLAYDLLGEQERAQRDYRLALQGGADDETARRYALSLGISGRRDEALAVLEPLLRRQDRGAWRAQAFVLAMAGDAVGADKVAVSVFPTAAAGLAPFFRRVASLPAADRAFAVHFGEVRGGPDRLADARLAPALPALMGEGSYSARREVGSVSPRAVPAPVRRVTEDRSRRTVARVPLPAASPIRSAAMPVAAADPVSAPVPPAAAAPTIVAQAPVSVPRSIPPQPPVAVAASSSVASASPATSAPVALAAAAPLPIVEPTPAPARVAESTPAAVRVAAAPVARVVQAPRIVEGATPPVRDADSILARIVASITIPQSEMAAASPAIASGRREAARETADRAAAVRTIRAARAETEGRAVARASARSAGVEADAEEATPATRRGTVKLADRGKAPRVAIDAKPATRRGAIAGDDAEADAPVTTRTARGRATRSPEKAAPAKTVRTRTEAEPSRIWVQVAGGANEGDLGKAWTAARKTASGLAGRSAYTTRNRATNRVVTGPFKTDAEARAFVNKLRGQGVGAFSFTSDAGQKMTKLPATK